jgi:hypothetical protein
MKITLALLLASGLIALGLAVSDRLSRDAGADPPTGVHSASARG